jgi:uncharacterized lipoprotein
MKTFSGFRLALFLLALASLTGCSTIAGLFPDKQKQYRYSSDLPPLEVPPDLSSSTLEGAVTRDDGRGSASKPEESGEEATSDAQETASQTASEAEPEEKPVKRRRTSSRTAIPTLAQNAEDAPLIEIDEPFAEAWNDVHRALGRLEVEVTDQNRSDRVFFVHYAGPDHPKRQEETGLWSDIKSVFSSSDVPGEDLRVKLEEGEKSTNIFVLDTADKPTTTGLGLDLLKRLNDTLQKLDQPDKTTGDGEPEPEKSP